MRPWFALALLTACASTGTPSDPEGQAGRPAAGGGAGTGQGGAGAGQGGEASGASGEGGAGGPAGQAGVGGQAAGSGGAGEAGAGLGGAGTGGSGGAGGECVKEPIGSAMPSAEDCFHDPKGASACSSGCYPGTPHFYACKPSSAPAAGQCVGIDTNATARSYCCSALVCQRLPGSDTGCPATSKPDAYSCADGAPMPSSDCQVIGAIVCCPTL